MNLFKKIILYLFGLFLLLFGNRKYLGNAKVSFKKDNLDDIEKQFGKQKLKYDTIQDKLANPTLYFHTVRIDVSTIGQKSNKQNASNIEAAGPSFGEINRATQKVKLFYFGFFSCCYTASQYSFSNPQSLISCINGKLA